MKGVPLRYQPMYWTKVIIKRSRSRSRSSQGHHTNGFKIEKYKGYSSQTCEKKVKGQGQGQNLGHFDTLTKIELILYYKSSSRFINFIFYISKSKVKVKVVKTLRVNISETKRAIEVIFSQIVIYSPLKSYALITDKISRSVIRSRSFWGHFKVIR